MTVDTVPVGNIKKRKKRKSASNGGPKVQVSLKVFEDLISTSTDLLMVLLRSSRTDEKTQKLYEATKLATAALAVSKWEAPMPDLPRVGSVFEKETA